MTDNRLADIVSKEAFHWGKEVGDDYHGVAASHMQAHWDSILSKYFNEYPFDMSRAVDFAAGYGRNTRKLLEIGAAHVTAIDVNDDCIKALNEGLDPTRTEIIHNSGSDLSALKSDYYTFFYSFDAMVHFDLEIILSYIPEFARVLKPHGFALIHHSNYSGNPGGDFRENPHWRNFMSADIFKHIATRSGFKVLKQEIFAWGDPDIDCISILQKA